MNIDYKELIPKEFAPNSRVWIYQADRSFSDEEVNGIRDELSDFNEQWNSHGAKVLSFADILLGRFIVLMADETTVQVGGCSTDVSTRFLKELEKKYTVSLFDRQSLAFIIGHHIETVPLGKIGAEIDKKLILGDTLYFNNTITTKKELLEKWIIPVEKSWLAGKLK